jgi:hypothetical protein
LGLVWGEAFRSRLGAFGFGAHNLGYTLLMLGGLLTASGGEDSPLLLLFPIGGLFITIGAVLIGTAAITVGRRRPTACTRLSPSTCRL